MSWNLNCRKVQRLLALWAGNDIDEAGRVEAERHMASCPHCRESWGRLNTGRQALERLRTSEAESAPLGASIWPVVERQIRVIDHEAATANWRGWLPVGALAAACVAILVGLPAGQGPETAYTPSGSGSIPVFFSTEPSEGYRPNLESGDPWRREGEGLPPGLLQGPRVRTLLDGTDVRGL
jgi:hypothetical protein